MPVILLFEQFYTYTESDLSQRNSYKITNFKICYTKYIKYKSIVIIKSIKWESRKTLKRNDRILKAIGTKLQETSSNRINPTAQ